MSACRRAAPRRAKADPWSRCSLRTNVAPSRGEGGGGREIP